MAEETGGDAPPMAAEEEQQVAVDNAGETAEPVSEQEQGAAAENADAAAPGEAEGEEGTPAAEVEEGGEGPNDGEAEIPAEGEAAENAQEGAAEEGVGDDEVAAEAEGADDAEATLDEDPVVSELRESLEMMVASLPKKANPEAESEDAEEEASPEEMGDEEREEKYEEAKSNARLLAARTLCSHTPATAAAVCEMQDGILKWISIVRGESDIGSETSIETPMEPWTLKDGEGIVRGAIEHGQVVVVDNVMDVEQVKFFEGDRRPGCLLAIPFGGEVIDGVKLPVGVVVLDTVGASTAGEQDVVAFNQDTLLLGDQVVGHMSRAMVQLFATYHGVTISEQAMLSGQGAEGEDGEDEFMASPTRSTGLEGDESQNDEGVLGEEDIPDSPELEEEDAIDEEALREQQMQMLRRQELAQRMQDAKLEREALLAQNAELSRKVSAFFATKRAGEYLAEDPDRSATDVEQRYFQLLHKLSGLQTEAEKVRLHYDRVCEEMADKVAQREGQVTEAEQDLKAFRLTLAKGSEGAGTGRPVPPKLLKQFEEKESQLVGELDNARKQSIQLKLRLKKAETALRKKEELSSELHLIDFEQLKIENQTLNEKIEERNEDLLKLRKKTTSTVQVLTHLKEKLQFVQAENNGLKSELSVLESELSKHRDTLTQAKLKRDKMRRENSKLRAKSGLVGNQQLLRDYDRRKREIEQMTHKVETLREKQQGLATQILKFKKPFTSSSPLPAI